MDAFEASIRAERNPGMATAAWLAQYHDRPWSDAAVSARLPAGLNAADPTDMARVLGAAGLRSRLVLRKLGAIDPAVLPCVLFRHSGEPLIMTGLSMDGLYVRVIDPADNGLDTEMPRAKLAAAIKREVLLVTPDDALAGRRLSERAKTRDRHWFWGPLRENKGAWVQIGLAALCINLLALALPLFVMNVYDRVIPNLAFVTLWTLALGVGIAIGLDLILRAIRGQVLEVLGRRLDTEIAASLFAHAMSLRPLSRKGGASVLSSQIRDFETVREFFGSASFVALIDTLFIGVFLYVLWLVVGELAFVPLAAVPIIMLLALIAQTPMAKLAEQSQKLGGERNAVLTESLLGHETVKTLGAEPVLQREWERSSAASARINGRSRFWSNITVSGTQMIQQAVSVVLIVWGVFLVSDGSITVGALIAANILAGRALAPMGSVAHTIFRAQYALKALRTLSAFMKIPPEAGTEVTSAARVRRGGLRLEEVSFRYPDTDRNAVTNLSLQIAPGECVALLGRVGSGKSTLGKLICGLVQADSGKILVDDRSVAQYDPAELRSGVGYLPQEPELFTGTFGENLVIGRPNASVEETDAALRDAAMTSYVEADPEGLQRFIGEKGSHLSGGQRQGLSLARLLLRRPKLMFLDEPTNAMDRDMEAAVAARLAAINAEGTGLILCTHRPGLAQIAERWIVMEAGRILLDDRRDVVMARLQGQGQGQSAGPGPRAAE